MIALMRGNGRACRLASLDLGLDLVMNAGIDLGCTGSPLPDCSSIRVKRLLSGLSSQCDCPGGRVGWGGVGMWRLARTSKMESLSNNAARFGNTGA
ncbi:hypothetical protein ElyMa_003982100 [Elysia marginata]|uniref:Uncharacterized protein n=1 Tax=Elysia marginata TaxID=1093978 RepID=A0AAV4FYC2_9GAST|nr:hypothetical protein ElyMa_003982100 [Elysia marginata]